MPRNRSADIDDIDDFNLVKILIKNEKNYLNKFSLKNKKALIIGGCGLLGEKITEAVFSAGAEVIILDINNKKGKNCIKI